jgi:MYXO-CTERM domain-containing protein
MLAASGFLAVAQVASASTFVNVGNHNLLPGQANQVVVLQVTNDVGTTPPQVTDFAGYFQIGPNTLDQVVPVFQGADFTGTFWGAGSEGGTGPEVGVPQLMQKGFTLNSGTVAADGDLIRLIVDTTGITSGTFDLKLIDSAYFDVFGSNSNFLPSSADESITITNGTITVTPEPGSAAIAFGLAAAAGLVRHRRRRGC